MLTLMLTYLVDIMLVWLGFLHLGFYFEEEILVRGNDLGPLMALMSNYKRHFHQFVTSHCPLRQLKCWDSSCVFVCVPLHVAKCERRIIFFGTNGLVWHIRGLYDAILFCPSVFSVMLVACELTRSVPEQSSVLTDSGCWPFAVKLLTGM